MTRFINNLGTIGMMALVIASLATGCYAPPERGTLAELAVPEMHAYNITNGDSRALVVQVRDDGDCALLESDFNATVNGIPMTIESLGKATDDDCQTTRLLIQAHEELLDAPMLTVEAQDSTMSMIMDFTNNLRPREITIESHPDRMFRRGEQVRLRWDPATDSLAGTPNITLAATSGIESQIAAESVTLDDHDIAFIVPEDAPLGQLSLDISPSGEQVVSEVHRCDGAGACNAANKDQPRLQVIIAN